MKKKKRNTAIGLIFGAILLAGTAFAFRSRSGSGKFATPVNSSRIKQSRYAEYAKFLEAMAKHETASYTSSLAREYNNIFGMGYPLNRPSLNDGFAQDKDGKTKWIEGQKMSAYLSYDQAIEDMLLWMKYTNFPLGLDTVNLFSKGLKDRNYYTDSFSNYTKGLERYVK